MVIEKCANCGRLFSPDGKNLLCSKCRLELEDHFMIAREYVYGQPNATVKEVAEGTGVTEKEILDYIRKGRLQLKSIENMVECQRCGKLINSGRFCKECAKKLSNGLVEAITKDNIETDESQPKGWHSK